MSDAVSDQSAAPPDRPVPTVSELFISFFKCSILGFGGVMPWARRMIVEDKRWMSAQEFNETFSLSQFLPGPNIVNFSVVFGRKIGGPIGGVAGLVGIMGPPLVVVTFLGILYAEYGDIDALRRILAGIAASAAGFIIAAVAKMVEPVLTHWFRAGPLIVVATFVAMGLLRWPLPQTLAVLIPISVGLAFWMRPR